MTASPRRRLSPELPLSFTMSRMLSWSIAFTTFSYCSGEIGVGWWLWMSITGNLARGTGCCGTTSVERGLYSRMFGGGHSGWRPSAGRGRIWPGVCVWAWETASERQSSARAMLRFVIKENRPPSAVCFVGASILSSSAIVVMGVPWQHSSYRQTHRSEEHTSELQSPYDLVCRLLLE